MASRLLDVSSSNSLPGQQPSPVGYHRVTTSATSSSSSSAPAMKEDGNGNNSSEESVRSAEAVSQQQSSSSSNTAQQQPVVKYDGSIYGTAPDEPAGNFLKYIMCCFTLI